MSNAGLNVAPNRPQGKIPMNPFDKGPRAMVTYRPSERMVR